MQTVVKIGLLNYRVKIWECRNWVILITVDKRMILRRNISNGWKHIFALLPRAARAGHSAIVPWLRYHVHTVIYSDKTRKR